MIDIFFLKNKFLYINNKPVGTCKEISLEKIPIMGLGLRRNIFYIYAAHYKITDNDKLNTVPVYRYKIAGEKGNIVKLYIPEK